MSKDKKIAFVASRATVAQTARAALIGRYGNVPVEEADLIVALGGDGFMLQTLHDTQHLPAPVYGMNRGTIGFLMNTYSESDLIERLAAAEREVINPLRMRATHKNGRVSEALETADNLAYRSIGTKTVSIVCDLVLCKRRAAGP